MKVFEAQHRAREPFDASVVLLDDVVQVFALTDFNAFVMVSIKLFQGIVKLSEFDQKLGKARIHNSLIVQHSCYRSEVENRPNST